MFGHSAISEAACVGSAAASPVRQRLAARWRSPSGRAHISQGDAPRSMRSLTRAVPALVV
jgi:hypothetical protein